jgi:hypothetical protein
MYSVPKVMFGGEIKEERGVKGKVLPNGLRCPMVVAK